MKLASLALLLCAGAFAAELDAGRSPAVTFGFDDPKDRDAVRFVIDAPFGKIYGLSHDLEGTVTVTGSKADGELRTSVGSIQTGNSTRDGHLWGDSWLDAKTYPFIRFNFKDVELPQELANGQKLELKAKGTFSIHGVERVEPVQITAWYEKESEESKKHRPGDLLHLTARFRIHLEDYKIAPRRGFLKVGEDTDVSVDAWGSTAVKAPKP